VGSALRATGISAHLLELELTESSLMANTDRTIATLRKLKARGVQLALDDFGTGYSCLAYLRHFPIDKLKIDVAFVRHLTDNADDAAIARTIIRMAHSLKLDVIAEGVETAAQLSHLRREGCDQIQGYLISRPLPAAELETLLRNGVQPSTPGSAAASSRTTLLIVDDDTSTLASLEQLLRQDGYRILLATSAADALELLARHHVHVILCDYNLPDLNGAEFFHRVKDLHPDSVRLMLSQIQDSETVIRAVNKGAIHGFYTKPWQDEALRLQLRDAFRHYRLLHDVPRLRTAPSSFEQSPALSRSS